MKTNLTNLMNLVSEYERNLNAAIRNYKTLALPVESVKNELSEIKNV